MICFAVVVALAACVNGASVPVPKDRSLSEETAGRQLWDDDYYGYRRGYYRRPYYRRYRRYPYRRYGYRRGWGYDAPAPDQDTEQLGGATAPGVGVVSPGFEQQQTTGAATDTTMFGATDVGDTADTEAGTDELDTDFEAGGNRKLQWDNEYYNQGGYNYGGYRGRALNDGVNRALWRDYDYYDYDDDDNRAAAYERVSYRAYGDGDWRRLQADDMTLGLTGTGDMNVETAAEGIGAFDALDTAAVEGGF